MRKPELKQYLWAMSPAERDEFAGRAGTTWHYLRLLCSSDRVPTIETAIAIAKATRGDIALSALRPDLDWQWICDTECYESE